MVGQWRRHRAALDHDHIRTNNPLDWPQFVRIWMRKRSADFATAAQCRGGFASAIILNDATLQSNLAMQAGCIAAHVHSNNSVGVATKPERRALMRRSAHKSSPDTLAHRLN
jgi:hypothetical protein